MYSVEDLLISHGYKLPKHPTSSTPTPPAPAPSPTPLQPPASPPPAYSMHHEILENRPGSRTMNGYESGAVVVAYGNGGGTRQPQAFGGGGGCGGGGASGGVVVVGGGGGGGGACPNNNNEPRDRSQPRREGENRSQTDTHSLGESLTSDSGFCDGTRGPQAQSKDVSYWRRRGQDFTVLLDYADFRDPHAGMQGGFGRPEGPQQARGQELSAEERQRAAQERQRWAAQAQAQAHAQAQVQAQAHAQARSREREAALHHWRMANERKCQSLGTDEWRPAVSFARQLSQAEGERWAQEQQRLHARTPDGVAVHPRTKAKSQSLPRMLQPESLHYVDIAAASGQELFRRVNGHPLSHHDFYRAPPRWPENGRPASATQLSMTPKPRFTRPPRPPSYEMHQQIRGSCEVLSGRDSVISQGRDRTPLPMSRPGDPHQLDYFAQESGPPGYIPPPSYKRAPIMAGGRRGYGEINVDYRYRGDVYPQIQVAPDGSRWFTRHPGCLWPDPQRERSTPCQKQLYPVYTTQERPGGGVQYIPFDDPRIRHISAALGGNSLTDADKIRHIRNELPSVTVSEPAPDDSAFLPPPLGPFIGAKLADDAGAAAASSSPRDNDNNRWHSDLHKETVDNFPAPDQNCNNRYPKNPRPPPSPSSAFQAPIPRSASRQGSGTSDQVFAETITQVKKIAPDSGPDNARYSKRRVSETIFCLVSVPVHTPTNFNKDLAADQNNNETMSSLTIGNTDTFAVGLKESLNIRSKSVNEMPIKPHYSHFYTSSTSSMRNYKRAPLRKEIIDAWALQASEDKELCYAGSWPGNQYRNQETQTGSPLTGVKSPEPQSPLGEQEPVQSASDTTTDSGVGTDNGSAYAYPMAGQNNFNPSSNSAFSRLNLSPVHSPSLRRQDPSSPSKGTDAEEQQQQQPSSPSKRTCSPPEGSEQAVFGQFLLKPVNRRPCDAIGELESINKEMEDTISKRPNASRSVDDLDGMNRRAARLKSRAHFNGPEPGRDAISLPPLHTERPANVKVRSKSFASTADLDSMDARSAFTRPQANNVRPTSERSILPNSGPAENSPLSPVPPHNESNGLYKQDIPVPQESLLRDVGLTVYTETPGGPGEPVQRSLSVPSPLDCKDPSQPAQLSWETRTALVKNSGSPEHNSNKEPDTEVITERKGKPGAAVPPSNLSICRSRSEGSRSPQKRASPTIARLKREVSFVFGDDRVERYALSEPLSYKNESTIADRHLESLLIREKANALPTEDLSNLYEVKCAKGIPENESIEQRAARILGIAVPAGALKAAEDDGDAADSRDGSDATEGNKESGGNEDDTNAAVADKETEGNEDDTDAAAGEEETEGNEDDPDATAHDQQQRPCEGTPQVIGECEQVEEEPLLAQVADEEEVKENSDEIQKEEEEHVTQKHSEGGDVQETDTPVIDLPEFPPSKLLLSLPISPDQKLVHSIGGAEKKGRGGAAKLIESLQDKLNSSASSSANTERKARLKELDSVSRIRRLSLRGSESEGEAEAKPGEDGEAEREERGDVRVDAKEEVVAKEEKVSEEEKKPDEAENAQTLDKLGDFHEDCKPEEENGDGRAKERRKEEGEEVTAEIALRADKEGRKDGAVESQKEEPRIERAKPRERLKEDQSKAPRSHNAERGKAPKPKQRTRLQKPPLLPKPRSVPKREITLPVSFSTGTCGPSNLEEEEMLTVSDSYDPSRVERV